MGIIVSQLRRIAIVVCISWMLCLAPSWAQLPQETYDFSMSKGIAEFGRGHYDVAAEMFELARTVKPDDLEATDYLGQTYLRLKRYDAAESLFLEIVNKDPKAAPAWLGLGIARNQQGQYQAALEALSQAEQLDPKNPLVYFYQGLVAQELKSFNQAPELFSRAMALSPDLTPSARYYTGISYYQRGLIEQAEKEFEAAITSVEPESKLARLAQAILQQQLAVPKGRKQWDLNLSISEQYDSNVVLLPGGTQPPGGTSGISQKHDFRTAIYARGEYRPIQTDVWTAGVTYGFYQSFHQKLAKFDVQDHSPSVFVQRQIGPVQARVQYVFDYVQVGQTPYLYMHVIQPIFTIAEGNSLFTQLQFRYQYKDFQNDLFATNSFRDGKNWLGGVTQYAYFANGAGHVRLGYTFDMDRTGGGDPTVATPGVPSNADWAYKAHRLSAGFGVPPVWTLKPNFAFDYYRQQYDNPSSLSATGTTVRRDSILFFTASIGRPITDWLSIAAEYNYVRDQSNIQFFDYSRNIYSVTLSGRF
jgi:tetratricopeptide (TPR) repeat protein